MSKNFPFAIISVFTKSSENILGNTAAVILMDEEQSETQLQNIASTLNQPATTFLWPTADAQTFKTRWFAPDAEIGLCGHGAMAACEFLFQHYAEKDLYRSFKLLNGDMIIPCEKTENGQNTIQLEAIPRAKPSDIPKNLENALGKKITAYYSTENKHIVELENEESLASMHPNFEGLRNIDVFGYAVTAKSAFTEDFVCRTLVPHVQQLEDHATGSTQAILVPYWAEKLGKTSLSSKQLSKRGGYFEAKIAQHKVTLYSNSIVIVSGTFFKN